MTTHERRGPVKGKSQPASVVPPLAKVNRVKADVPAAPRGVMKQPVRAPAARIHAAPASQHDVSKDPHTDETLNDARIALHPSRVWPD